jgi:zinc protease
VNVPTAAAVIKQEQVGTTSRFVLQNGITVIINEQHATPIAAMVACFKAGALDEPEAMTGIARLVQHMIFKGTMTRPAGKALNDLRAIGGLIDADTSYDRTTYSAIAPADRFKEVLAIQADMLENPALDSDGMRRELPLVIEEEKLNATRLFDAHDSMMRDEQSAYSLARLYNVAFAGSPAGRWRPASAEALRSITRDQMAEFYRAHYRPDKLIITVVGDVSTFNTLVQIQQLYGDFGTEAAVTPPSKPENKTQKTATTTRPPSNPQADALPRPQTSDPDPSAESQPKLRYSADRGDINQSIVTVGFRVPGLESKDWAAIEVLATLIGRGRASRLNRSLLNGQMVATRVEASYLPLANASAMVVQMWIVTDAQGGSLIDKAESAFFNEIDETRRQIPGEGEMARAKTMIEKRMVDKTGTYIGRAREFAMAEAVRGGLREALDYRNQIRAVRAEDVQRVAQKYFTFENTSVHEYEPLTAVPRTFDAESFAKTVAAWSPGFLQAADAIKARAADPNSSIASVPQGQERATEQSGAMESIQPLPVKDFSTLNGPQAYVREDHSQPKVTVTLFFQGGRLIEDESTSGITELMLRSMLYGTARRTPEQIAQDLDQLGADVEVVVEPDFFGFVLSVLSRNADRALKILHDVTEDPAFRDGDIQRARLAQIVAIRNERDSSLARARALLNQAMWPGHPYSLSPHGREEVVTKVTGDQLKEWHARAVKRQLPLAVIVGDTNGSALVSSQLAEGFRRRELDQALQVKVSPPKVGEKIESRRREQTTAAIGFAGPKSDSADLVAIELLEALMNWRGGRLLQELRDRQGLALAARLDNEALFVGGSVYAQIITAPENEQRARAALIAELERVARAGVSADELNGARAIAATSKLALLQSSRERALEYARAVVYQRKAADVDAFAESSSKISADDIKRVASGYFKSSAASSGIVRGAVPSASQPAQKQN